MIPIQVKGKGNISMQTEALVDSGAYSIFIHERIIKEHGFKKDLLPHPYNVFNADNTPNKAGMITHQVMLKLKSGEHESAHSALITNLGTKDIILGMTYLRSHNPEIDWKAGTWHFRRCSTACGLNYIKNINPAEEEAEESEEEGGKGSKRLDMGQNIQALVHNTLDDNDERREVVRRLSRRETRGTFLTTSQR